MLGLWKPCYGNSVDSLESQLQLFSREPLVDTLLYLSAQYLSVSSEKSLQYASEAMILAENIDYTKGRWKSAIALGEYNSFLGNYLTAMQYFLQSMSILKYSGGSPQEIADVMVKIGNCYLFVSEWDKALSYYREALEPFQKANDSSGICQTLIQMGTYYGMTGDFQESLKCYNQALDIAKSTHDARKMPAILNNIGNCFRLTGDFDQALSYTKQAQKSAIEQKDKKMIAKTLTNLAGIYLNKKDYPETKKYLQEAEKAANEIGYKYTQIKILDIYSSLYIELGDFAEANKYYKQLIEAQNAQQQANNAERIASLQVLYDVAGKERQMQDLQNEVRIKSLKSKAYIVLLIGISLIMIVAGSFFYFRVRMIKKRNILLKKEYSLEQEALEQEKNKHKLLEQQISMERQHYEMDIEKLSLKKQQADIKAKQMEMEKQQANIQLVQMGVEKSNFEEELAAKNRELASITIQMLQKNESLATMRNLIAELQKEYSSPTVDKLLQNIENTNRIEKDWDTFVLHFTNVHPGFFDALQKKYPELTEKDIKHCAYIRMRLSLKEVATLMNISVRGVQKAREKIHALMHLDAGISLQNHLQNF